MYSPECTLLFASLLVGLPLANAHPMSPEPIVVDGRTVASSGEHPSHRTASVVLCIVYGLALGSAQGYRAGRMAGRKRGAMVSDVLVFVQGFLCITFLFAVGINTSGLGLSSDAQCHAAIRVCIALYILPKTALNLFLLERVYIVRAPFVKRTRDPVWMIGVFIVIAGYGSIMGWEYIRPEALLVREDGICRIGIQSEAAAGMMTLDTVTNVVLTGIFIWHLRTSSVDRSSRHSLGVQKEERQSSALYRFFGKNNKNVGGSYQMPPLRTDLRIMLVRNVIGSIILLVNTLVPHIIFLTSKWTRMGHACMLMCLTDIVLGMLVTQWLTMRSVEQDAGSARRGSIPNASNLTLSGKTSERSQGSSAGLWMSSINAITRSEGKPVPVSNEIYKQNDKAIHIDIR